MRPSGPLASVLLLLGVLLLAQGQAGCALFGVVWRTVVLSWDNPDTHLVEDLASQAAPSTDPSRHAHDRILIAAQARARAALPYRAANPPHPALTGRITRSPPVA